MTLEIGMIGKTGPCCVCGPPVCPTPKMKIVVVTVSAAVKFALCKSCYRDFYVKLPGTCCAFGDCKHERKEPAFTLEN